ncbi:inositol monophosphatase family protein [Candidatus Gracilibacteria bacterium]|nr:inositol monophosphatase family protein [Candidatus Gracilibacteria bacterium]NJM87598.1 inositol monophosphatase family protein [Hydrococcus sp. RU_2_2]NJP18295.1 inositol monophosphatase family protein [Hydrococcus sp. CRU_1_1]
MDDLARRTKLAEKLADVSAKVIKQYFRQPRIQTETKEGEISAIVTIADREAENAMVEIILKEAPGDGIIREEGENIPSENGFYWVLDPIDGTSSFVKGLPIFGTLIGLVDLENNQPLIGIINQPILQERWLGVKGKPTLLNNCPIVNPYAQDTERNLAQACLTSTTPLMFVTDRQKAISTKLQQVCQRTAFGGDCYNYAALASGWSSMPMVVLDSDMKYYDFCALIPIVEGVGGVITDWSGERLTSQASEVLAASNRSLWEETVKIINSVPPSPLASK